MTCHPDQLESTRTFIVGAACHAAIAAIGGVSCYYAGGGAFGAATCAVAADAISDVKDLCPDLE